MSDLFTALGWDEGWRSSLRLGSIVAGLVGSWLLLGLAFGKFVPPPLVQALLWAPWLAWLGHWFPSAYAAQQIEGSQKLSHSLLRHAAFGSSWNFAQQLRPGISGLLDRGHGTAPLPLMAAGVVIVIAGAALLHAAITELGVARAFFLPEYIVRYRQLITSGVYGTLRHPLFVAGFIVSTGITIMFWSTSAIASWCVNLAVVPLFVRLEDRRYRSVFPSYAEYRIAVPGVIPRFRQERLRDLH